jgi:hypothetical protein
MRDPAAFVSGYLSRYSEQELSVDRLVTEPSGLDLAGVVEALGDPRLGRLGVQLIADLMRPDDSIYFDAIFGAYDGQAAIRGWLIPAMAEIEFVEFVPQAPTELFDDGEGGTSLDEWQMVAVIGDERVPLPKGVSVRRLRDGWITWAVDVYDTGPMRQPPPGAQAPELPPVPVVEWPRTVAAMHLTDAARAWLDDASARRDWTLEPGRLTNADAHSLVHHAEAGGDIEVTCALFHPEGCRYIDPLFGEFDGRSAISAWLRDVMPKIGKVAFEPVGPALFNGATSLQEWVQVAVLPSGERVDMARGTSVRRYGDGMVTYAADYFDTASFADPRVVRASLAAGSTLTKADLQRYRSAG